MPTAETQEQSFVNAKNHSRSDDAQSSRFRGTSEQTGRGSLRRDGAVYVACGAAQRPSIKGSPATRLGTQGYEDVIKRYENKFAI